MNGKEMRAIRLAYGLTQQEFSQCLGTSLSSVAMAETGKRKVTDRLRFKIARHFPLTTEVQAVIESAEQLEGS
ncbi:helix-turn-helix transcriptional regulator [Paenibacillus durus]|uniref:HTH cro/C1-type domain-containing protein n=1 Tax=Paenibacillus durus TaxID=44251 RepID=A0A089HTC3_PAEDU|nr:helix-turn-helix transcriptional regulator [Paenibacillus durus]AIQ13618.1 hypothetical protein PDUR_18090 [Paenibacillus durus]